MYLWLGKKTVTLVEEICLDRDVLQRKIEVLQRSDPYVGSSSLTVSSTPTCGSLASSP
ncbi:MAG: hypothetical protein QXT53_07875 [Ignisphaera sp.]